MTIAKVAVAGIGFLLGAFALAWPAPAVARGTLPLADMGELNAGTMARPASSVPPQVE